MKKFFMGLLTFLLIAVAAGWVYLRHFERQHLYHPDPNVTTTPAQYSLRYQDVQFVADDGTTLTGWWLQANRPRATVVY